MVMRYDMDSTVPFESSTRESRESHSSISTSIQLSPTTASGTETRLLKTLPLAILIFYNVSGGPFGVEESVRAAGPFYTLIGFCLAPFVWSLPESQITAELSVAFPHSSGGAAWCEAAFGPFASFLNGNLSCISASIDNCVYPLLFLEYVLQILPEEAQEKAILHPLVRFLLLAVLSICWSYMNWRGLDLVGNMSIGICVIAMSPFIVLTLLSVTDIEPSRWFVRPNVSAEDYMKISNYELGGGLFPYASKAGVLLRPFANNLFWNFNSYDGAAAFSEEIGKNRERVMPCALNISWFLVSFGYLIPLLVAIGVSSSLQREWVDGYMASVATEAHGAWLGNWVVFGAAISNLGLYLGELSCNTFRVYGLARRRLLPTFLDSRSRYGTPTNAIILATMVVIGFSFAPLDKLVELLNFNYSLALLMEFLAFIKLRISKPHVHRPYRVPLGTVGCIIFLIPPICATLIVILLASFTTMMMGVISILATTVLYIMFEEKILSYSPLNEVDEDMEII